MQHCLTVRGCMSCYISVWLVLLTPLFRLIVEKNYLKKNCLFLAVTWQSIRCIERISAAACWYPPLYGLAVWYFSPPCSMVGTFPRRFYIHDYNILSICLHTQFQYNNKITISKYQRRDQAHYLLRSIIICRVVSSLIIIIHQLRHHSLHIMYHWRRNHQPHPILQDLALES